MPLNGCNRCGSSCFPAGAICDLILLIRQIVCFLLCLKLRLGQRIGLLLFPEPGFLQFPLKLTIVGGNGIGHVIIRCGQNFVNISESGNRAILSGHDLTFLIELIQGCLRGMELICRILCFLRLLLEPCGFFRFKLWKNYSLIVALRLLEFLVCFVLRLLPCPLGGVALTLVLLRCFDLLRFLLDSVVGHDVVAGNPQNRRKNEKLRK